MKALFWYIPGGTERNAGTETNAEGWIDACLPVKGVYRVEERYTC